LIRKEAISLAISKIGNNPVVAANGYISRDLFEAFDKPSNFYMIGSMGLASSIGLGIALKNPKIKIFVFDGDGNILMNLGSLTTVGFLKPKNFVHIVSTGGQPTSSSSIKIDKIAKSANYKVYRARSKKELLKLIETAKRISGPLIFTGHGVNSSSIISQMVRQIDIFPTVIEIIGLTESKMNVYGRSLYPLFKGERLEELPVYIENDRMDSKKPGNLIGLRTSNYKYYRARNSPRKKISLYDLKNDPNEKNNIATKRPDIVDEMEKILTELKRNIPPELQTQEITDEETKKVEDELRKLGYI